VDRATRNYALKIAVVGSRHYPSKEPIEKFIVGLPQDTVIISGGAIGVDTWAEEAARAAALTVKIFHADWDGLGRKAGPMRNAEIVKACEQVVAFWDGKSRGTLNTVVQAWRAALPVRVFGSDGTELLLTDVIETVHAEGIVRSIEAADKPQRPQGLASRAGWL